MKKCRKVNNLSNWARWLKMGESRKKEKAIASVPGHKILTYRTAEMRVIMQLSEIQY